MSKQSFADLNLLEPIHAALKESGYDQPTPIQLQSIPVLLQGRDLLGCAQTGTGKTAAFAIPILQRLTTKPRSLVPKKPRVLVLTPTRELAIQVHDSFVNYGKYLPLKHTVIFGGVGQAHQVKTLSKGVDVLVATPGRLLDLINQGFLQLDQLEVFVLDEADRMLDMGFIHDVKKIIAMIPSQIHNLFFSASMPTPIENLANSILKNPVRVEVNPVSSTVEKISQSVCFVERENKRSLLKYLLKNTQLKKVIVFSRTKHGANKIVDILRGDGVLADAIHGNKSQTARQNALENFRVGKTRVLVATDIAARGIDVDGITHVINFDLPNDSESYVHRIGRTARAGASGAAISFCDAEEKAFLKDIEKLIKKHIPVDMNQPYHSQSVVEAKILSAGKAKTLIDSRNSLRPQHRGGKKNFRSSNPRKNNFKK
jgi:ATP-dependent RNA helicase RhlE